MTKTTVLYYRYYNNRWYNLFHEIKLKNIKSICLYFILIHVNKGRNLFIVVAINLYYCIGLITL